MNQYYSSLFLFRFLFSLIRTSRPLQVHVATYTRDVARAAVSRFHPLRRVNLSENSIFSVSSVGGCPTGLRCTLRKKKYSSFIPRCRAHNYRDRISSTILRRLSTNFGSFQLFSRWINC